MSKNEVKNEAANADEEQKQSTKFYPDVIFNRKERSKTVIMASLLIVLMGGMGLTIILGGIKSSGGTMAFISGALTLVCLVFAVSMIPNAFKQYPVNNEPLIEIKPREITINGTPYKLSDVTEVRLTLTLDSVGKKEDDKKMLDAIAAKEPPKNTTANLDFAVKEANGKSKTLYTTIADGYEALVAVFSAGVMRHGQRMASAVVVRKSSAMPAASFAKTLAVQGAITNNCVFFASDTCSTSHSKFLSNVSVMTRLDDNVSNVSGVTKRAAFFVMTTLTDAPDFRSRLTRSQVL